MRTLRIAAAVEAASLTLLLLNLFTVHTGAISSLGGLVHGTAYLTVIVAVFLNPALARPGTKGRAFIPGIGGLLALRVLGQQPPAPSADRLTGADR